MKHVDPYLSAEALQCTEEEREALIWVYNGLASGLIKEDQYDQGEACGTARCIGGWMASYMGMGVKGDREIVRYVERRGSYESWGFFTPLGELFWGRTAPCTVEQGAQACLNTLTFGDPKWLKVLGWR